jgi:hypothetical protein
MKKLIVLTVVLMAGLKGLAQGKQFESCPLTVIEEGWKTKPIDNVINGSLGIMLESFDKTWATYIEYLTAQDQARERNAEGTQRLISETCAIGYNKASSNKDGGTWDDIWKNGGACYAK